MTTLHESLVGDVVAAVERCVRMTPSERAHVVAQVVFATAPYAERVTRLEAELKEAREANVERERAIAFEARQAGGRVTFRNCAEHGVSCSTCDGEGSVGIEGDASGEDSEECEECMGLGVEWPDLLFSAIDGHAPEDDASIPSILAIVDRAHPRSAAARLDGGQ